MDKVLFGPLQVVTSQDLSIKSRGTRLESNPNTVQTKPVKTARLVPSFLKAPERKASRLFFCSGTYCMWWNELGLDSFSEQLSHWQAF